MTTSKKSQLRSIMQLAWSFVRRNGYSMSEALKAAWRNAKLVAAMHTGIVEFFFKKVDGSMRQAFGTLAANIMPQTQGTGRKPNDNIQVYFDTMCGEFRSFRKCNLESVII